MITFILIVLSLVILVLLGIILFLYFQFEDTSSKLRKLINEQIRFFTLLNGEAVIEEEEEEL